MLFCESEAPSDAYNEGVNGFSISEILIMRSIEKALDDGMDIINLSIVSLNQI
jgi:hypothetical protein